MKKITLSLFIFSLLLPTTTFAKTNDHFNINAESAILVNTKTGEILYEKNADKKLPPASLTKVMTLAVASKEMKERSIKGSQKVTISTNTWQTGGVRMYLEEKSEVTIHSIEKGLAVTSGNDGAVALAEGLDGDSNVFISNMNKEAKALGMNNTVFTTVHGFSKGKSKDITTARDLLKLTEYYTSKFPENAKLNKALTYVAELKKEHKKLELPNTNPLLGVYPGLTGLKSGSIEGKYNIIATASKNGVSLIGIVLGAKNDSSLKSETSNLLDYGFSRYKEVFKGKKGEKIAEITTYKTSSAKITNLILGEDASFIINLNNPNKMKVKDKIPSYIIGAHKKGYVVGKRIVTVDKKTYTFDIVLEKTLKKAPWWERFFDNFAILFNKYVLSKL